jgi:hypothetical protein
MRVLALVWIVAGLGFEVVTAYFAYTFVTMPCPMATTCGAGVFLAGLCTGLATFLCLGVAGAFTGSR